MTDLRPLLSGHNDEFELALLRSAQDDEPADAGMLKAASALGLGASAVAGGVALGSATAGALATQSSSAVTAKLGVAAIFKSLAIGAATGLVTIGTFQLIRSPAAVESRAPVAMTRSAVVSANATSLSLPKLDAAPVQEQPSVPEPRAAATSARRLPSGASARAETAPLTVEPAPSARAAFGPVVEPSPAEEPPKAAERGGTSLGAEIAAIDAARVSLRKGDAAAALDLLDRYAAQSPTRVLETEATVLRIDALVQLGQRARAQSLARDFVTRQPSSRHAERLRQLVSEAESR
jgi:hypothetical protein